jgi:type III secretion protein U
MPTGQEGGAARCSASRKAFDAPGRHFQPARRVALRRPPAGAGRSTVWLDTLFAARALIRLPARRRRAQGVWEVQASSEDKSLPASAKKLADARRKGQVAHSRDLVTVVALVAGFLYLGVEGAEIMEAFRAILTEPIALTAKPFDQSYTIIPTLLALASRIVAPLVIVIVIASVVANVGFLRGIPFSLDPIVPRGDKINPVTGFQRLFSLRNLLEFVKAVVKACTLIGVIGLLALAALRAVLVTPQCGQDCIGLVLVATLKPVLAGIIAVLLVFALIDMMLQRWLFQRDQRMTRSEMKRERKEQEGDPHIRSTRRQLHRGMARGEGRPSVPFGSYRVLV